jgi:hypothetical protein
VLIFLGVLCIALFLVLQEPGFRGSSSSGGHSVTVQSGTVAGLNPVTSLTRAKWLDVVSTEGSCGQCAYTATQTGQTSSGRWGYMRGQSQGAVRFDYLYVFHRRRGGWALRGDWAVDENFANGFCGAPASYPGPIRRVMAADRWPCPRSP